MCLSFLREISFNHGCCCWLVGLVAIYLHSSGFNNAALRCTQCALENKIKRRKREDGRTDGRLYHRDPSRLLLLLALLRLLHLELLRYCVDVWCTFMQLLHSDRFCAVNVDRRQTDGRTYGRRISFETTANSVQFSSQWPQLY